MMSEAYSVQKARAVEILETIRAGVQRKDRQRAAVTKGSSLLVRAIENLDFANGLINPNLQDVLRFSGRQVTFHPLAHHLFAGYEIVFDHKVQQGMLVNRVTIEGRGFPSEMLTPELIREKLWEANHDRRLVRYFGGLSQAKIVDKFLQTAKK